MGGLGWGGWGRGARGCYPRQALKSPHIVGLFCPSSRSLLTLNWSTQAIRLNVRDELTLSAPCAGAQWTVGALEYIAWSCRGAVRDDVTICIGSRFFKYATVAEKQPEASMLKSPVYSELYLVNILGH